MNQQDLVRRREQRKLTQRQLAKRLGVSSSTVSRWEAGVTPISAAMAMAIDQVLRQEESVAT